MSLRFPISVPPSKAIAIVMAFLALYIATIPPEWLPQGTRVVTAVSLLTITLWATSALPEHLTALVFFAASIMLGVAPPEVIFSGFHSSALWLVFGGMVIGAAIKQSGLANRVASHVAARLHGSYVGIIAGMVILGTALAFVMPSSMGRILLLVPISQAVASRFGFQEGDRGRTGIVLASVLGTSLPTFSILTANLANMVLMGAADTMYGLSWEYGSFLLMHFPVLGALRGLMLVAILVYIFPARPTDLRKSNNDVGNSVTREEYLVAFIVGISTVLWITDWLHGISPAWVALIAATVCLLPQMGILSHDAFNQEINYKSVFLVAGIVGLSNLVATSGLGEFLARILLDVVPLGSDTPAQSFFTLSITAAVTGIFATTAGTPAILAPLAGELSEVAGISLESVLATYIVGISMVFLPYQIAPIIVGVKVAGESISAAARVTLLSALLSLVLLLPLDYLWLRMLGWG
jgi:anion transporter